MDLSGDELAGVVDLFGGLTRAELHDAAEELAFKRDVAYERDAVETAVDRALDAYRLVALDGDLVPDGDDAPDDEAGTDDEDLLVVGPVAFPTLPDGAADLPHILDVPERAVDREQAAKAARDRLETEALAVAKDGDSDRASDLLDVCYDLEAWAPVDTAAFRDRLADV